MKPETQQFILQLLHEGREWASLFLHTGLDWAKVIVPALVAWHMPQPKYMQRGQAEEKKP